MSGKQHDFSAGEKPAKKIPGVGDADVRIVCSQMGREQDEVMRRKRS